MDFKFSPIFSCKVHFTGMLALRLLVLAGAIACTNIGLRAQEVVYELVTNESQLAAGGKYIIVSINPDKTNYKWAMGCQQSSTSNRYRARVDIAENMSGNLIKELQIATENEEGKTFEFTLDKNKDKNNKEWWGFYDRINGGYLRPSDKDKYELYVATSSIGSIRSDAYAQITIDNDTAAIVFNANSKNKNGLHLNAYTKAPRFSCYGDGTINIRLYRKRTSTFKITSLGYTTFTSATRYEMPQGCTGFLVTKNEDGTSMLISERYKAGDGVPPNTPLLISGSEGEYSVYETTKKVDTLAAGVNALHCEYDENGLTLYDLDNKDKYYYYKLTTRQGANFGFYWGADDGGPFTMKSAERAYLVLNRNEAAQVKGLVLDEAEMETAISVPTQDKRLQGKIFNLAGQEVHGTPQKGIYIQNGRKVVMGNK